MHIRTFSHPAEAKLQRKKYKKKEPIQGFPGVEFLFHLLKNNSLIQLAESNLRQLHTIYTTNLSECFFIWDDSSEISNLHERRAFD